MAASTVTGRTVTGRRLAFADSSNEDLGMKGLGLALITIGTILLGLGAFKFSQAQLEHATGEPGTPQQLAEKSASALVYAGIGIPMDLLGAVLIIIAFSERRKDPTTTDSPD